MEPTDTIKIPETELELGNPTWMENAHFYALDSETFGITGKKFEIWSEIAKFEKDYPIDHEKNKVVINLPNEFKEFYRINEKHYSVSLNNNNILVTITGRIIS